MKDELGLLKYFKILLALGLLTRFALSFWTGHPWDFEVFIRVGSNVANGGNLFQSKNYYVEGLGQPIFPYVTGLGYPPAWGLYAALAYKIYRFIPISPFLYYFMLKLAPILGDLAVTYMIFLLTLKSTHSIQKAMWNSLIFFLCPFVIFISSVWGMFDSLPTFFTLTSILLLLSGRLYLSAFCLGLGIYVKIIPVIYLPIQLLFINKKAGIKEAIIYFLISCEVPFVLTLVPTILFRWEISQAFGTVISQSQPHPFAPGDVLTYWNLSAFLRDLFRSSFVSEVLIQFFSFPTVNYLWILGLIVSYFLYYRIQNKPSDKLAQTGNLDLLLRGFSLTTICFLLTRTFVPEQYVLYLLPAIIMLPNVTLTCDYYYKRIWIAALIFAFVNNYPFSFAYLINAKCWYTFNYLATTPPFSTLRYAARFAIATLFDFYLIKLLLRLVRRP